MLLCKQTNISLNVGESMQMNKKCHASDKAEGVQVNKRRELPAGGDGKSLVKCPRAKIDEQEFFFPFVITLMPDIHCVKSEGLFFKPKRGQSERLVAWGWEGSDVVCVPVSVLPRCSSFSGYAAAVGNAHRFLPLMYRLAAALSVGRVNQVIPLPTCIHKSSESLVFKHASHFLIAVIHIHTCWI